MKKIYLTLFLILMLFCCKGFAGIEQLISPDQIYVFTQATCSHCWAAEDYLKEEYPDLKIQKRDIADSKNLNLFFACAAKFKLDKTQLGTPLFCMGDHYIMGWGRSERKLFEEYVEEFLPKE